MKRAIRNLIRFVAAGLIIFGGLQIGLEFLRQRMQKIEINTRNCVIGGVLILSGVVIMAVSSWLAGRLSDDDDEGRSDFKVPPPEV
ncbi:MAG TPA: hypothetical protein VK327_03790 [Candidatus Paceibacterota bacterium]|nr:hypothetical protein [Candidatus Paceibacterota bacterium]